MDGWSQLLNLMYPLWRPVNMFVEMSGACVALDLNRDFPPQCRVRQTLCAQGLQIAASDIVALLTWSYHFCGTYDYQVLASLPHILRP